MDLNIVSILYLAFRLAPFILVSYFTLSSVFNHDFKGIIFLIGLLIASAISMILGNSFKDYLQVSRNASSGLLQNTTDVCNLLTLTKSGPLSLLPLSQVVFSYTFGFLLYIIINHSIYYQNIPTMIVLPALIIGEFCWAYKNNCTNWQAQLGAGLVGMSIGLLWSMFIVSTKVTNFQYFNAISNKETCSLASKQNFKCSIVQSPAQ
jgi:hypothetical protein